MINETLLMNGYGFYVWSAFVFTLLSFAALYIITMVQFTKERKKFINNNNPLLIANSDQIIEWNSNEYFFGINSEKLDASILTFNATHPKWSFVKKNSKGNVIKVAEKKPISNEATVGIYYWKKGKDYVKYAEQMINKNIRTNNEYFRKRSRPRRNS